MRYLITFTNKENKPFMSQWYEAENHFNEELGMVVFDLYKFTYTTNGKDWEPIQIDHL